MLLHKKRIVSLMLIESCILAGSSSWGGNWRRRTECFWLLLSRPSVVCRSFVAGWKKDFKLNSELLVNSELKQGEKGQGDGDVALLGELRWEVLLGVESVAELQLLSEVHWSQYIPGTATEELPNSAVQGTPWKPES